MDPRGLEQPNLDQVQVTQEELEQLHTLMRDLKVEIDSEALGVVANLLRLNVSPDEVYSVLKQIAPVCGLFKRFKLKPQKSTSLDNNR